MLAQASAELLGRRGDAISSFGNRLGLQGVFSVNPLTGTPTNVAKRDGFLTGPSNRSAEDIALGYVSRNLQAFGLDQADLDSFSSTPKVATDTHGIRHVSWTQSYNGVKVFGNGLRAHVAKDGSLISVQGAPVHGLAELAAAAPDSFMSATSARSQAGAESGGALASASEKTATDAQHTTTWSNGDTAELVYFVTPDGVRLGWSTYTQSDAQAYQHVIDAASGRTLYRHSTVNEDRGDALAFANAPGQAGGGKQTKVNLFDRGYLSKNATWLRGKYVFSWADTNDDDLVQEGEKTPVPGTKNGAQFTLKTFQDVSSLCTPRFLCTWDPDVPFSWRVNKKQDATQGFVVASRFHDYLLADPIGFTPQMGNFELNGGDPVLLNVLDGANTDGGLPDGNHIDNATMSTPPDGVPPTMSMFLNHEPGTTANQDPYLPASGTDAADNIFHEYTHGLSNRLVVDAGGNSTLNSLHAGSMGEAWSDYYAMDFLVTKGYVPDTAANGQVLFDSYLTHHRAITRSEAIDCAPDATANLCTKAIGGKGGYTFGDLGNATGGPEVHADSEIWGQTLWDLRAKLGHKVTAAIVTEAMAISPADPSFLDERDAILLADQSIYGAAHKNAIWRTFADRGMGWFASASDGSDAAVVEDFSMPPSPSTPRYTVSGQVTDDQTGDAIEGAVVSIPGHASGVSNYTATTDASGRYSIQQVIAGDYPEIIAQAPGYKIEPKTADVDGDIEVDFSLRRDWAASSGGADLVEFTGPDYSNFGCGPQNAIDLSYGQGWSSDRGDGDAVDTPDPKYIVVKLPQPIEVSAFGVDPTATCGDAGSASAGDYRIEVSADGDTYTEVEDGQFTPADRGRVNEIPVGPLTGVRYVKFWIDDSQVEQLLEPGDVCSEGAAFDGCVFMDITELEVYGVPSDPTGAVEQDVQILSFNDFHGHLEATDTPQAPLPAGTPPVGGVEYLSAKVKALKAQQPTSTLTVAAGDLIGGSTFLSGLFQDEPSVEAMNELGLDVSSVGNHEFDEGTDELLRMVNGGCQPAPKGCFKDSNGDDIPYDGTGFDYLAANVIKDSDGEPLLPATSIKTVDGVKIGFIGMTLEGTPSLVSPGGIDTVEFMDEVETANAQAAFLQSEGVESIVVLLHEGGAQVLPAGQTLDIGGCVGLSGPIVDIANDLDPAIDMMVTGHTHQPYVCSIDDPAGDPRLVTSAASFGQVLTQTHLTIDLATQDVVRDESSAANLLVTRDITKDANETAIIDFWNTLSAPLGNRVVGTLAPDTSIVGDQSTCRCEETPLVDLVADAILWGTEAEANGGAEIAFMNTGGVRAPLLFPPSGTEQPGEITFRETYNVAPFNNILVTVDMTGEQIEDVLNQQFQRGVAGRRVMLSLGVSDGFTYEWAWEGDTPAPNTQPGAGTLGGHVVPGSMELNGVPIVAGDTYRVGTLNFLTEGGDAFTVFRDSTNKVGGDEDLHNLAEFFSDNPGLTPPADRVTGL